MEISTDVKNFGHSLATGWHMVDNGIVTGWRRLKDIYRCMGLISSLTLYFDMTFFGVLKSLMLGKSYTKRSRYSHDLSQTVPAKLTLF